MLCVAAVVAATQLSQILPTPGDEGIRVAHDYVADLAALAPVVPPEQRAWEKYVRPYGVIRCAPDEIFDMPKPGDPGWERASAYCREHRKELDEARQAAAMPFLGFPLSTQTQPLLLQLAPCPNSEPIEPDPAPQTPPRVFDLNYGYGGIMRSLTRFFRCDARIALQQKDGRLLVVNISAMLGLARHAEEHANSEAECLSIAIVQVAADTLGEALESQPEVLSTDDLRRLKDEFAAFPPGGRVRLRLDFDRALILDELQRTYSDDGKGDGRLTVNGIREVDALGSGRYSLEKNLKEDPRGAAYFWTHVATRKETLAEFDARTNSTRWGAPLWTWKEWPGEPVDQSPEAVRNYKGKYPILAVLLPGLRHLALASEARLQCHDAVQAALAVELFHRRTGAFPKTLQELVPAMLDHVPVDRFTGDPLRFAEVDGRLILYSLGPDLDDDHGRPSDKAADLKNWRPPRAARSEDDPAPDGDWVLFLIKCGKP
jgi:hypothetical protein